MHNNRVELFGTFLVGKDTAGGLIMIKQLDQCNSTHSQARSGGGKGGCLNSRISGISAGGQTHFIVSAIQPFSNINVARNIVALSFQLQKVEIIELDSFPHPIIVAFFKKSLGRSLTNPLSMNTSSTNIKIIA